jgi:hypothetical protein
MEDLEIGTIWAAEFPKWQDDTQSNQICRIICELIRLRANLVTDPKAQTAEERLQYVLDSCGIPREQFDEVSGMHGD